MLERRHILLLAAAALLTLAGCLKDPGPAEGGAITIEASIGAPTKVTYDGEGSTFAEGDKIAVYAWTGSAAAAPAERVVDGIVNTLGSDGKWIPASVMYWKPGSDAHYFLGVSPLRAISDFTADAVTLSGTYASDDLLFARNFDGLKPGTSPVALTFSHAMARLTVNVKVRNEFGASPAVSVSVTARSGATVNYLTQAVTATGDASARSLTAAASAPAGYTHSFGGIQVPQDGVRTVTLTVGGKNYVYEAGEDIPLSSGHHTTLGLILGKDKLELSGVSVSDWTAGSALSGGDVSVTKINGHAWIDLGLPSGLKWAACNVGATEPEEPGDFFAWGETFQKTVAYTWSTLQYCMDDKGVRFSKYVSSDRADLWGGAGSLDNKTVLDAEDDAATANWGAPWRTPTDAEWTELRGNCDSKWTTQNGVPGYLFTSKKNQATLFLPAAGYRDGVEKAGSCGSYWSSSLYTASPYHAWYVDFDSGQVGVSSNYRYRGRSVRPVLDTPTPDPKLGDLYYSDGTWSSTLVAGKTPIGVIAYLGEDAFTETGTDVGNTPFKGHGLVLCLKNAASNVCWSTETSDNEFGSGAMVNNLEALNRTTDVSGYMNTAALVAKDGAETKYPAAYQARNYKELAAPATGTTGWFLPTAQQWVKMMTGLGGLAEGDITWNSMFNNDHSAATAWETAMAKAGAKGTAYDSVTDDYLWYWSSSEFSAGFAVSLVVAATGTGASYGFYCGTGWKVGSGAYFRVRPVLAF